MASASLVIDGCAIATVDDRGTEYTRGHIVVESGRITAIGEGSAAGTDRHEVLDGTGALATPGLVNCHHHLYHRPRRPRSSNG